MSNIDSHGLVICHLKVNLGPDGHIRTNRIHKVTYLDRFLVNEYGKMSHRM